MIIGIVTRTYKIWVDEFINACQVLDYQYKLIDIDSHNWFDQLTGVDLVLWRIHLGDMGGLHQARIKIPIIEKSGVYCFPSSLMTDLYDNKILQSYFFRINNIPTPKTIVSFNKKDADEICSKLNYPVVVKTSGGAGSEGVSLNRSAKDALKYNQIAFDDGILIKLLKAINYIGFLRNLKIITDRNNRLRYVYYQMYIKTDGDYRITTLGNNIVSAFKRINRKNDFRASGSGAWVKLDLNTLPSEACDIALKISDQFEFTSMAFDFVNDNNTWLILEISYSFLLNRIYSDTLFQKVNGNYIKIDSLPIGVMHVNSCRSIMRRKE